MNETLSFNIPNLYQMWLKHYCKMANCLLKSNWNVTEGAWMLTKRPMKLYWNVIDGLLTECDWINSYRLLNDRAFSTTHFSVALNCVWVEQLYSRTLLLDSGNKYVNFISFT